jgi:Na+:H+ antiporter
VPFDRGTGLCWPFRVRPPQALLFGALIAATDPIAAIAILSKVGLPKNLETVVDGESLLNDGVAGWSCSASSSGSPSTAVPLAAGAFPSDQGRSACIHHVLYHGVPS